MASGEPIAAGTAARPGWRRWLHRHLLAEGLIGVAVLNRMTMLGKPESVATDG